MGNKSSKSKNKDNLIEMEIIQKQKKEIQMLIHHNNHYKTDDDVTDTLLMCKNNKDYEYLVFSGGCTKAIAYIGALEQLNKYGILNNIHGYAGTSAGSIIAALLAVGYTIEQIREIMMDLDFNKIYDDKLGIVRDSYSLITDLGIASGQYLYDLIGELIKQKLGNVDYTLKELYDNFNIKLCIVGSNITDDQPIYFSHNINNIPIRQAVRISISIPYMFEPVVFDDKWCVDGGIFDNYPIHVFDGDIPGDNYHNVLPPNPCVLGLKLIGQSDPVIINNLYSYSRRLVDCYLNMSNKRLMSSHNYVRTIPIVTDNLSIFNFNISNEDKLKLIISGSECIEKFF